MVNILTSIIDIYSLAQSIPIAVVNLASYIIEVYWWELSDLHVTWLLDWNKFLHLVIELSH